MTSDKQHDLRTKVAESDLRAEAKARAAALLAGDELTTEHAEALTELIQDDIDADFAEIPGVNEAAAEDQAYLDMVAAHELELKKIEEAVQATTRDAEEGAAAVAELTADIETLDTELKIGEVQGRLAGN
jgi:hypothetical protein